MHQRLDIRDIPDTDQRISMSGVMIAFFILSLPMTMFQLGAFGSAQRLITFVICAVALFLLYQTRAELKLSGGAVFWVAYATWIFLSITWTARIGSQLTVGLGMVLLLGALVLMAMLPVTETDLRVIRMSWMLLAVFAAVLFLVFGEQAEFGNRTHLVLPSGGSDPNEFSAYFLMPLAYFVEAALEKSGPLRVAALASTLGAFYIVLMTGSRAGAIASLVVIGAVALRFAGQGFGKFLLVSILGFIGIFAAGRILLPLVPEEVRERLSIDALLEDSGSARDEIWRTGIELMEHSDWRLLFGYGPNGAPLESRIMHNHFVQALVDGGLIGLAFFLLVIISALIVSFRNKAVFAATLGVAVMFLTLTAYSNFRPAWAVLFMALLVARRAKSRDDAKHPVGESWRKHHAKRAV